MKQRRVLYSLFPTIYTESISRKTHCQLSKNTNILLTYRCHALKLKELLLAISSFTSLYDIVMYKTFALG